MTEGLRETCKDPRYLGRMATGLRGVNHQGNFTGQWQFGKY